MSYDVCPDFGCHLWTGPLDRDGYGMTGYMGKRAHVVAWELANGPVPNEKQVGHDCMRRRCCNPAHMTLETPSDNLKVRRGRKGFARRVAQKVCRNGHDMRLAAMITPEGGRLCRVCMRAAQGDAKGEGAHR